MRRLGNNQSGFAHIIVLLAIVIMAAVGFVGWRALNESGGNPQTTNRGNPSETDIVLQNLGLTSFENVEYSQYALREYASHGLKGFYVFGDKLSEGRSNPNFEYASLKAGTQVISATDGVVVAIKEQPGSKDSEVFIQSKEGSTWTVGYDHLTNLAVKKGDAVKAGDALGEPAVQNNGLLRFEIQINKDENGTTTHYCPSSLLATDVKDKWLLELTLMQNKWESISGLELYNVSLQDPTGCIKKTMTPSEAEGR